jgi:hypothetical protein
MDRSAGVPPAPVMAIVALAAALASVLLSAFARPGDLADAQEVVDAV